MKPKLAPDRPAQGSQAQAAGAGEGAGAAPGAEAARGAGAPLKGVDVKLG